MALSKDEALQSVFDLLSEQGDPVDDIHLIGVEQLTF
jgi:hypothetical protein